MKNPMLRITMPVEAADTAAKFKPPASEIGPLKDLLAIAEPTDEEIASYAEDWASEAEDEYSTLLEAEESP